MPLYEVAIDFVDKLLVQDLGLPRLFLKIKQQYKQVDYPSTLKLLVRARIVAQIRNDALLLTCRYLDFMQCKTNIQQLRDENATDSLIQD